MIQIIIAISLLNQVDDTQRQREWLMARLIVDRNFTSSQLVDVESKLAKMSPSQIETLVLAYKEQQDRVRRGQERVLASAIYQLKEAEVYRDYLSLKYQRELSIKRKEMDIMRKSTNWMQHHYFHRNHW